MHCFGVNRREISCFPAGERTTEWRCKLARRKPEKDAWSFRHTFCAASRDAFTWPGSQCWLFSPHHHLMSSGGQEVCKRTELQRAELAARPIDIHQPAPQVTNKKGTLSLGGPQQHTPVYSHFLRCPSGSSHPGTVSAAGNRNSPESCCWTTGQSETLCRCGSRPSAWRGSGTEGRVGDAPSWEGALGLSLSMNLLGTHAPPRHPT